MYQYCTHPPCLPLLRARKRIAYLLQSIRCALYGRSTAAPAPDRYGNFAGTRPQWQTVTLLTAKEMIVMLFAYWKFFYIKIHFPASDLFAVDEDSVLAYCRIPSRKISSMFLFDLALWRFSTGFLHESRYTLSRGKRSPSASPAPSPHTKTPFAPTRGRPGF